MQENYKILVVDDDMRLRALLERYLTEQGFQVRSVANAEQMDRLLTRESFHLMVLDLMLPGRMDQQSMYGEKCGYIQVHIILSRSPRGILQPSHLLY